MNVLKRSCNECAQKTIESTQFALAYLYYILIRHSNKSNEVNKANKDKFYKSKLC